MKNLLMEMNDMTQQILTYYPLMSFEDIDWKIKELGKVWRNLKNIEINYEGGAYRLSMIASGLQSQQNNDLNNDLIGG